MLVHASADVRFDTADLSNASAESLADLLHSEVSEPFDLERGPLIKAKLVKRAEGVHVLVITGHHVVLDGWSFNVLAEELSALYTAGCRGERSALPIAKQFEEYSLEVAGQDRGSRHEKEKAYWLEQFSDLPDPIGLPLDRPYPVDSTFAGGAWSIASMERLTMRSRKPGQRMDALCTRRWVPSLRC